MPGKSTIYGYDNAGNRTSLSETYTSPQSDSIPGEAGSTTVNYKYKQIDYAYSDTDKILTSFETLLNEGKEKVATKKTLYAYDYNGNQIGQTTSYETPQALNESIGVDIYTKNDYTGFSKVIQDISSTYDGFNRLTSQETISKGEKVRVEFTYTGDDLKVRKLVKKAGAEEITGYIYDRANVILETGASNETKARYIRGINYIARIGDNKHSYYLYNGHAELAKTALINLKNFNSASKKVVF